MTLKLLTLSLPYVYKSGYNEFRSEILASLVEFA